MSPWPDPEAVETLARELWREREMALPPRLRRLEPDNMDMVFAWPLMLADAEAILRHG